MYTPEPPRPRWRRENKRRARGNRHSDKTSGSLLGVNQHGRHSSKEVRRVPTPSVAKPVTSNLLPAETQKTMTSPLEIRFWFLAMVAEHINLAIECVLELSRESNYGRLWFLVPVATEDPAADESDSSESVTPEEARDWLKSQRLQVSGSRRRRRILPDESEIPEALVWEGVLNSEEASPWGWKLKLPLDDVGKIVEVWFGGRIGLLGRPGDSMTAPSVFDGDVEYQTLDTDCVLQFPGGVVAVWDGL